MQEHIYYKQRPERLLDPLELIYNCLCDIMCLLGTKLSPVQEQQVLITTEPTIQPPLFF